VAHTLRLTLMTALRRIALLAVLGSVLIPVGASAKTFTPACTPSDLKRAIDGANDPSRRA
jgi:hypothetical protein